MANQDSILATVVSEFSLFLADCQQESYDFNIEIQPKSDSSTTSVRLLLEGDGLSCWVNGEAYSTADLGSLEDTIYRTVRDLPVVNATIREINRRADEKGIDN